MGTAALAAGGSRRNSTNGWVHYEKQKAQIENGKSSTTITITGAWRVSGALE